MADHMDRTGGGSREEEREQKRKKEKRKRKKHSHFLFSFLETHPSDLRTLQTGSIFERFYRLR